MSIVTTAESVNNVFMGKPHVVLLGAGASRAALPHGDRWGRPVPLLRELAVELKLEELFPNHLRDKARTDFEGAYSQLVTLDATAATTIENEISNFFSELELPDEPTLYDVLNLSLRDKDAIFTFNWDPFLMQSRIRLAACNAGPKFPQPFFLHGNVTVGYCQQHKTSGINGRTCSRCGNIFEPSPLLFPVENKNYQDGSYIEREWDAIRGFLKEACWFTVFGYSAPSTDVEAVKLLRESWGSKDARAREQFEIVCRPGANRTDLLNTWRPFLHSPLHYSVQDSLWDSWMCRHPRRSGEAHWNAHYEVWQVQENPIPKFDDLLSMVEWFDQFRDAEAAFELECD